MAKQCSYGFPQYSLVLPLCGVRALSRIETRKGRDESELVLIYYPP